MKTLALCLVLFAGLCFAQVKPTGNSYCNNGACNTTTDCDLGLCCGSKCVLSAPNTLAKDSNCSATDQCSVCSSGQYCNGTYCVNLPATTCGASEGCNCSAGTDCLSGYCGSDKKCHGIGLGAGDMCVDKAQCSSQNCTNGTCVSATSCIVSPFLQQCGYGQTCVQSGFTGTCTAAPKLGDNCNGTCGDYGTSCQAGKCANFYSVAENGNCTTTSDCTPPAVCTTGKCVTPSGNCRFGNCGPFQTCKCTQDNKGTTCTDTLNVCSTEWTAFATCMRTNQCVAFSSAAELNINTCVVSKCGTQYLALQCCQSCGGKGTGTILAPSYGLNCATKTFTPLGCDTSKCPRTVSTCGVTTTGVATTGASAAGTTGAATMTMTMPTGSQTQQSGSQSQSDTNSQSQSDSQSSNPSATTSAPSSTTSSQENSEASFLAASFALIVALFALL